MSKLPENCPICGKRMEKGYIYHGAGIYWTDKKQRWLPQVERIQGVRFVGAAHFLEGYRCIDCKIVLFDYAKSREESKV